MATSYGNTKIVSPTFPKVLTKKTLPPVIDEENPIPDKYEGDIIFNKTIYSLSEFKNKTDFGFSELVNTTPNINIQQFFDLYNELFFDIPKEGENSHTTIIQTSIDYLDNYVSPLQAIIDSKDVEIQSLNQQLLAVQGELASLQLEIEQEEALELSQEAQWLATYGNVEDPILKLSWLETNLDTFKAQGLLDNDRDSYFDNIKEDLIKAYGIGGSIDVSASQWKNNIDQVGGSTNTKKADLKAMVDKTVQNVISNAYEVITNAWKI